MNPAAALAGLLLILAGAGDADLAGRVLFAGQPVPGATVTATLGDRAMATVSGDDGTFRFASLAEGTWTLRVEMLGFAAERREIALPLSEPVTWTLTMRPFAEIVGSPPAGKSPAPPAGTSPPPPDDPDVVEPDVINGSVNNAAASPFAQPRAIGNNRPAGPPQYNKMASVQFGNSALNARPYSFDGSDAPAPSYNDVQLGFMLGGPLRIPWLVKNGPRMTLGYQHGLTHNTTTQAALVPTAAERAGDFGESGVTIRDPRTGLPFPGNVIPGDRVSPQAAALAAYYPLPNVESSRGNYQRALLTPTTRDSFQLTLAKNVSQRTTMDASLALQRTAANPVNLFGFEDAGRETSVNLSGNWSRRYSRRLVVRLRSQFSRTSSSLTPFFANRINVSGDAGITGNDQDPANWGPPTLAFPSVADLADGERQETIRKTFGGGGEILLRQGSHNITIGGDVTANRTDVLAQPDPRGTLTFTGEATGNAFGDFLIGLPAASAIAFGNTKTRLRAGSYDAYVTDDWRLLPNVTLNLGVRWEYEAPYTEAADRLVNLDVARGFTSIQPVLASDPGALPRSLIRPDRRGLQPRLSASWRPTLSSPLVIRAGYGIYRNLGVYESLALFLAQQPPFSKTFSLENTLATPLTLANPFPGSVPGTTNTFAIDPDFRSADVHTWQVSAQRELPASLTAIAAYLGAKGTHLIQAFLPNTYPAGAVDPCPACPSGFVQLASTGRSLRNAAQLTLRRRLYRGLMASVQYTMAKSTDDAATFDNKAITAGSLAIAQDWLDLSAEHGPSAFDQRHLASAQFQYTTGVGVTGGTLVDGVKGALFKDWTVTATLNSGSGLPATPISFLSVSGTGVVGVRPALTGVTAEPPSGLYANPAAYATPSPGTWGDAGRHSIRGPSQFSLDATLARVFRFGERTSLEWRVAATNVLNRVTFAAIDTVVTSPQFGLPTVANPMRTLHMGLRLRF